MKDKENEEKEKIKAEEDNTEMKTKKDVAGGSDSDNDTQQVGEEPLESYINEILNFIQNSCKWLGEQVALGNVNEKFVENFYRTFKNHKDIIEEVEEAYNSKMGEIAEEEDEGKWKR